LNKKNREIIKENKNIINNNHNKKYYFFRKQRSLQCPQSWSLNDEVIYLHMNNILQRNK